MLGAFPRGIQATALCINTFGISDAHHAMQDVLYLFGFLHRLMHASFHDGFVEPQFTRSVGLHTITPMVDLDAFALQCKRLIALPKIAEQTEQFGQAIDNVYREILGETRYAATL